MEGNNQDTGENFLPMHEIDPDHVPREVGTLTDNPPAVAPEVVGQEAASDDSDDRPRRQPLPAATNVQQDSEVFSPREGEMRAEDVLLVVPSDLRVRVATMARDAAFVNYEASEDGAHKVALLREGEKLRPYGGQLEATVSREGSAFRQTVKSEKGPLGAARPSFNDSDAATLSGEAAVLRMRAYMGLGGLITIPLWHSGFWITFKTPSDAALLELERRITEEKVLLGRATNGMLYSNTGAFIVNHLMQLAMDHVYSTSLQNKANIGEKIKVQDIQHIAWGLACAIYPSGFAYSRMALGETDEQNYVIEEKINVGKLQWTDTSALTERQIAHMARRAANCMTDADVETYTKDFLRGQGRAIDINDRVRIMLHVPSMDAHINAGQGWVNGIVVMVDKAFGMSQDLEERNAYIMDQGRASVMRQYSHWVESIELGGRPITDRATIDENLNVLTESEDARRKFFEEVVKFIDDATISVIAVPTVTPHEENKLPRFPHLVPIDAMTTFFTLLGQKVVAIRNR